MSQNKTKITLGCLIFQNYELKNCSSKRAFGQLLTKRVERLFLQNGSLNDSLYPTFFIFLYLEYPSINFIFLSIWKLNKLTCTCEIFKFNFLEN